MLKVNLELSQASIIMLNEMPEVYNKSLYDGLDLAMLHLVDKAKGRFLPGGGPPVPTYLTNRSQDLAGSIEAGIDGFTGWIGSNMEYAAPHEFGSPKQGIPKRSFIRAPVEENIGDVVEIIEEKLVERMNK